MEKALKGRGIGAACASALMALLVAVILALLPSPAMADEVEGAAVGDGISYTVSQKVNTLYTDCFSRYTQMSLVDNLPSEVDYVSAKVYRDDEELTSTAGTLAYDESKHQVRFDFSSSYLASMPLNGETYTLQIDCTIASAPASGKITNTGNAYINNVEFTSNTVEEKVVKAKLSIEKKADKKNYSANDTINYTLVLKQTEPQAVARNWKVTDKLPEGLELVNGSLSVDYGEATYEPATRTITVTGGQWGDYLKYGEDVTVTFQCKSAESVYGKDVANTAKGTATGTDETTGTSTVHITSPVKYYVDGQLVYTDKDVVKGEKYVPLQKVATDNTDKDSQGLDGWYTDEGMTTGYSNDATDGGFSIYARNTTSVTVTKVWDDDDDRDGLRGEQTFTVKGTVDGAEGSFYEKQVTLKKGEMDFTLSNLDAFHNGKKITYTVEASGIDGYTVSTEQLSGYSKAGWKFRATDEHAPATKDIKVTKKWSGDGNDRDGLRQNPFLTLSGSDGSTYTKTLESTDDGATVTFENLYVNEPVGKEITYVLSEADMKGYTSEVVAADEGFVVTNSHDYETVTYTVNLSFDDMGDRDGLRPDDKVEFTLIGSDGCEYPLTTTPAGSWSSSVVVPKYNQGKEVTYTLTQKTPEGYTESQKLTGTVFDVVDKHDPEKCEVTVIKNWDDNEDQDGKRPEAATFTVTGSDGQTATITATDDGTGKWSGKATDLYKNYKGHAVSWSVAEATTAEYVHKVVKGEDGYTFTATNEHVPATVTMVFQKEWEDNADQDGIRPESVSITVSASADVVDEELLSALRGRVDVTASTASSVTFSIKKEDGWMETVGEFPKYNQGKEVTYTVTEGGVAGYTSKVEATGTVQDSTASEGAAAETTYTAYVNGEEFGKGYDVTVNEDGTKFVYTYPAEEDGTYYKRTLTESGTSWTMEFATFKPDNVVSGMTPLEEGAVEVVAIAGAEATGAASTASYKVTNTHDPEKIDLRVDKVWKDCTEDYRANCTFTLTGSDGSSYVKELDKDLKNSYIVFSSLPKYNQGTEIEYTLEEAEMDHYKATVEAVEGGFTVTNTLSDTVDVNVTKQWVNDDESVRPGSISFTLKANGSDYATEQATADSGWVATFKNVPVYDDEGQRIDYSLEEAAVEGYTSEVSGSVDSGYTVTNTYVPTETGKGPLGTTFSKTGADALSAYLAIMALALAAAAGAGYALYKRRLAANED